MDKTIEPVAAVPEAKEDTLATFQKAVSDQYGWENISGVGGGAGTVDVLGRVQEPEIPELLGLVQRDTANTCADLISDNAAKAEVRLYVGQIQGFPAPKSRRKDLSKPQRELVSKANPLVFRKSTFVQEVLEHKVLELLYNPNPHLSYHDLISLTVKYLLAAGCAYWWKQKDSRGYTQSIWLLPSWMVSVEQDSKGFPAGFKVKVGGGKHITVPKDEMVFFLDGDLYNPYSIGYGVLKSCYMRILLEDTTMAYMKAEYDNGAKPSLIFTPDDQRNYEESQRMAKFFWKIFSGNGSKGPHFNPIKGKFETVGYPPNETISVEQMRYTRNCVISSFGISPQMFDQDAGSYASYYLSREQFYADCIEQRLCRIAEVINRDLCQEFDVRLFVAFDKLKAKDEELEHRKQMDYLDKQVISVNEFRETKGWQPVPWGDKPVAQAAPSPFGLSLPVAVQQQDVETKAEEATQAPATQEPEEIPLGTYPREKYIGSLGGTLKDFFRSQAAAVLPKLKSISPKNVRTKGFLPSGHIEERQWWNKATPKVQMDLSDWNKELEDRTLPVFRMICKKSAERILYKLGTANETIGVVSDKLEETAKNLCMQFCDETNQTTSLLIQDAMGKLREEMEQGLVSGDYSSELTARVQKIFEGAEEYRAYRIAITEESRFRQVSEYTSCKETGVEKKKFLLSSNPCELCSAIAKKFPAAVPLETMFSDSPYTKESYGLPAHPHCECYWIPVIE